MSSDDWPESYYAVIFTSCRSPVDDEGYAATSDRMGELVVQQPGFLGVESARGVDRIGITVSYWTSIAAIESWRKQLEHLVAQSIGRERWYEWYELRVAKVERRAGFRRD